MKTIEIQLYSFAELSETAKQKAIESMYDINVSYDWWESAYEDAANIGLSITGFDIDRGSYCKGSFIQDAIYTAAKIILEHGEQCETYKTAAQFQIDRDELVNNAPKDENGDFEDEYELDQQLDELEDEFLKSLLEDYRIILSNEYDYLTSEEAIKETIETNEYDFTEDGLQY